MIDYNTTADKFWKSSRLKVGSVVQAKCRLLRASDQVKTAVSSHCHAFIAERFGIQVADRVKEWYVDPLLAGVDVVSEEVEEEEEDFDVVE